MRAAPWLVCLLLAGALASGCFGPPKKMVGYAPDLESATSIVLYNGTVWTADDALPWATSIALQGERILAVGDEATVFRANVGARPLWLDLEGRFVAPGFHDTHNHLLEVASVWDPASGSNPFEPWPPGSDPVATESGRAVIGTCHAHAFAEAQVRQVRGDPHDTGMPGEEICAPENQMALNDLGAGRTPTLDAAAFREAVLLATYAGASFGITSHVEAGISLEVQSLLELYASEGNLLARTNLYIFPEDLSSAQSQGIATGSGTAMARVLGMKIYSDGWLGPRTAALREDYNDRPHNGFAFFAQDELDTLVAEARTAGLKVTAHTIGDRAVDMLLTAYERAADAPCDGHVVCQDPRHSLEHVQLVQPDLAARMAALQVVPSVQLSFATSDHGFAEEALGSDRLAFAYPWRTLHDLGLRMGGSSDFPVEVLPPLWGLQRSVTRMELTGEPAGGFMPEQALDLETALRMVTIDAAYLEFREHELGSLTPGKYADVVVLERNLFEVPPSQIADTRVTATFVGGRPVYVDPDVDIPGLPGPAGST